MELERKTKLYHFQANDGAEEMSKISQALEDDNIAGFLSCAESKKKRKRCKGLLGEGEGIWK